MQVLLIKDDASHTRLIEKLLHVSRLDSYKLEWAASLEKGLARLAQGGIDLILLDLSLPDSHEKDAFERVHTFAPQVPVVILSSLDDEQLISGALRLGTQEINIHNIANHIKTEQELRESEARFRALLESVPDTIVIIGPQNKLEWMNDRVKEMFGYQNNEIEAQPLEILLPRRYREARFNEEMRTASGFNTPQMGTSLDLTARRKDGSEFPIEIRTSPLETSAGTRIIASIRDLTERKLAEEARFRLASIIDSSEDAIISKTLDGIILSWNSGAEKLYGYRADEMIGKNVAVLASDDRSLEIARILDSIKRGGRAESFETIRKKKDGSLVDISLTISPIVDDSGKLIGASAIERDISERKQAENKLRESAESFRLMFANNPLPMWVYDLETLRFLEVNEVAIKNYGYTREEFLRMRISDIRPEEDIPRLLEITSRDRPALQYSGEWRHKLKNEQVIDVEIISHTLSYAGHNSALVVARDVSERKKIEQELERRVSERTAQLEAANKELEAFSYSVSHDLRAPLRAIDGFSRLVLEEYASELPGEAQRFLNLVRNNAQQMGTLIDDLLTFSRLSRKPLLKRSTNPTELVHQVLDGISADYEGRRVEFIIGDLPVCQADPALLKQVFVNLLSNAIKFTRQTREARIEISCLPDQVGPVFFVKDNGVGFEMQHAEKIFKVFQRLHRLEDYEGTGVGLANVQRIIQRHGGRIWAKAEPGQGATFYFTLGGDDGTSPYLEVEKE